MSTGARYLDDPNLREKKDAMVRAWFGSGAAASRLHLSVLGPTGAPVITLRVDKAEWWTLENITVLRTPDGSLVGAPFQHVNAAMGHLKKFLPHSNAANYIVSSSGRRAS